MKTVSNLPQTLLALVFLLALASGCASRAMWRATAPRNWQPYAVDQIWLVANTHHQSDVVVLFSQAGYKQQHDLKTRTVGWRISQPASQLAVTPEAIRQLTNSFATLQVVPCYGAGSVPDSATNQPPGYVVCNPASNQLSLHLKNIPPGPYTLPGTTQSYTTWRIIGMPIAVATDAAVVTVIILDKASQDMHCLLYTSPSPRD